MKSNKIILTVAFSLIMSAIAARAADIPIPSLPYHITVPGTYILKANLSVNGVFVAGITVDSAVAGPIVVDLQGFTISGANAPAGAIIYIIDNPTASRITIRNGTLQSNGTLGVAYGVDVNHDLSFDIPNETYPSNIHVEKITFNNVYVAVLFRQTNLSSVTDCIFTAPAESAVTGILDEGSQGGNHYRNDKFDGNQKSQLDVESAIEFPFTAGPSVLKDCRYEGPAHKGTNPELENANE